ncbi:hypothetical protein UA70_21715, partial [Raoultella planticola]
WMTKNMRWTISSASCCVYQRKLDDKKYALDHFQCKLLRLPDTMQTDKGKEMAIHNARFLVQFMAKLSAELRGDPLSVDEAVLRRFEPLA